MSAAESTSPKQFGWLETTAVTETKSKENLERYPEGSEERAASGFAQAVPETRGVTSLQRIELGAGPGERTRSHAEIRGGWTNYGSRAWGAGELAAGKNFEENGQGTLFTPAYQGRGSIYELYSTKKSRVAAMRGVGAVANIMERHTGREPGASTNLSPHSAPMVSKLTGVEHEPSNDIDFRHPGGDSMQMPKEDQMGRSVQRIGAARTIHITKRFLSDAEVAQGTKRVTDRMAEMRGRPPKAKRSGERPAEQGTLFPTPGSVS